MKQTRSIMGMHISVDIADPSATSQVLDDVFAYFISVDNRFSTYKSTSEISQINNGQLHKNQYSEDMKEILLLCEQTKHETDGYFDIVRNGTLDPSGIVKGWAIWQAAKTLRQKGFQNFYIDAGGDVQVFGKSAEGKLWTIGIKNPFKSGEIVKVISLKNMGIATSGTYIRGQHVYDPKQPTKQLTDIVSLTVIGPNVFEADRFATAAFAMQKNGIYFIEKLRGFEGYMIDKKGVATYTSHFNDYVVQAEHQPQMI